MAKKSKKKSRGKSGKSDGATGKLKGKQKGKDKKSKSVSKSKKKLGGKLKGKGKKGRKKKPKGPSWGPKGPKPVDPTGPPKKPPKKIKKKWPPKKKPKKRPPKTPVDSDLLQFADFAPHIGTMFTIVDFNPPVQIELIEIAPLEPLDVPDEFAGEVRTQPFSLLFLGPLNVFIPQDSYTLEHSQMGTLEMLLVPIGPWDDNSQPDFQVTLEAIYS